MSNTMTPAAFWMVWSPQGDSPKMRHKTREAADAEAERLARANGGRQFYVLQATTMYEASAVRRVELPAMYASISGPRWGGP